MWKAIELARGLGGEGTPIDRADALVRVVDAFVTSEQRERRCGAERAQVVVHLQADALAGAPDALSATLEDGSRVLAETLRRVACDATLLAVRTDESGNLLEIGRRTRVVSGSQRRALRIRDRSCRFPGCTHDAWLDAHHVEHWAHGGATTMSNLVLLCPSHHRLVHEGGFSISRSEEDGTVEVRRPMACWCRSFLRSGSAWTSAASPAQTSPRERRSTTRRCCLAGMGARPTSLRVLRRGDLVPRSGLRDVTDCAA